MVLDADGTPTNSDISKAFQNGVQVLAFGQVAIKPFGLVGHQNFGGYWSNKTRISLIQDPSNVANFLLKERFPLLGNPGPILERILERFAPELLNPVQPANTTSSTWALIYGFDQYFWQPAGDPKRGIGMFFNFGASDGVANPVKYSLMSGSGATGRSGTSGRQLRRRLGPHPVQPQLLPLLRERFDLGLDKEDVVEAFYNAAITKWLRISLDLQVINPGLQKTLSDDRNLKGVNNVVVGGVRTYIRF